METNNGIEAQNKILKYKFLPHKPLSLSRVATVIIEEFLPEQQRKYLFLNFQMDSTYRAYNTRVPSYLQGRPKKIILHCLGREEKARKQLSEKDILQSDEENGKFVIQGNSGSTYTVDFGRKTSTPSCTCQDWVAHNLPCKHFFLVFISKCGWGWNSLPSSFLEGPFLSCDNAALEKSQVLPAMMNDCDDDDNYVDEDLELSQNTTVVIEELPAKVTIANGCSYLHITMFTLFIII